MQDLISVVKIFGLSLVIVLLMQLRVSNDTLENHFEGWVQNSSIVGFLQGTADGVCKLGREGVSLVTEYTHDKFHVPEKWKPASKPAPTRQLRSRTTAALQVPDSDGDDGDDADDGVN